MGGREGVAKEEVAEVKEKREKKERRGSLVESVATGRSSRLIRAVSVSAGYAKAATRE